MNSENPQNPISNPDTSDWNTISIYPNYLISKEGQVWSKKKQRLLRPDKYGYYTLVSSVKVARKLLPDKLRLLAYPPKTKMVLVKRLKGKTK